MMVTMVLGARPNVVKGAPVIRELRKRGIQFRFIATGQHHSHEMWTQHLRDLGMPSPDVQLESSGSHAEMLAAAIVGIEHDLLKNRPDWCVVFGDVTSTLAGALAATKLGVRVAHVEAGLRSHDWGMPEEVNRVLVDRMADLCLYPDETTIEYPRQHRPNSRHVLVGNVMMDSLRWALAKLESDEPTTVDSKHYAVLTVHRPSNVDSIDGWARVEGMVLDATKMPILWPVHPRVDAEYRMPSNVKRIDPLGYLDMVGLLRDASLVITDSGGVYEEALYLGKKIISLRDPLKNERSHLTEVPEIWKSDAAPRIVDALLGG